MTDKSKTEQPLEEQVLSIMRIAIEAEQPFMGTISKPTKSIPWLKVRIKPVRLNDKLQIQLIYKYSHRDVTEVMDLDQLVQQWNQWQESRAFKDFHLTTTTHNYVLKFNKKHVASLIVKAKDNSQLFDENIFDHDRTKNHIISPDSPFLRELGLSSPKGEITKKGRDKFKQINKYIEILHPIFKTRFADKEDISIIDMGAGKGYLTFALYHFLTTTMNHKVNIKGVELRSDLVAQGNRTAESLSFEGLRFEAKDIRAYHGEKTDVLIALHACDTATDMAIAAGVKAGAQLIVLAPCCHKQVRKDTDITDALKPIYKHGILHERQSEIITDTIRALLLEKEGYRTRVFEFISSEHTSKNLMITAEKSTSVQDVHHKIETIKEVFGVKQHYLEEILDEVD